MGVPLADRDTEHEASSRAVGLELGNLHKRFGGDEVLKGIDLEVAPGGIVCVIGQSGSGKSTLLRCINLLETPDVGTLKIGGDVVFSDTQNLGRPALVALRRRVGMVFQQFNLFSQLTAIENITLPLIRGLRMGQRDAVDRAREALSHVGLLPKALAYPSTLSGGEKQRVAIGRALSLRPSIILFDEPTSSLDPESTREVLLVLRRLAQEGLTMIIATHEIAFAASVADKVLFIDQGIVVEEGAPGQVLRQPRKTRTRAFLEEAAM